MSTLITAVIIFGLLIVAHELGHFLVAKAVGIRVHEFSIGMGPSIFGKKVGETLYSLRAFPLGGFNRMAGMEPGEEDPKGFDKKSIGQRMAVIGSGSLMNFLLAIVLFVFIFNVLGVPSNKNVIGNVFPGKPAAAAGLQPGDKIVAINGQKTDTWQDLTTIIHRHPQQPIELLVERNQTQFTVTVTPERDPETNFGLIGIKYSVQTFGLFKSIQLGTSQAIGILFLIVRSLIEMVTGQVSPEVAGPIGIISMVGEVAQFGLGNILNFTALLSLNLGLINLLPIPALDGSRLVFLALEGIRGKPINPERESFIHLVGFALLIALMIIITYKDLLRIID